jgi:hypothetical protein
MLRNIFSLSKPIENLLLRTKLMNDADGAALIGKTVAISTYTLAGISLLGIS